MIHWLLEGEITMSPMSAIGVFLLGSAVARGVRKVMEFGREQEALKKDRGML